MSEALKILERAISDVGHWRWWVRSDTVFQVEFGWVMLLIPSEDASRPPSSTIALRFRDPRCIVALQRASEGSGLPDDWFAKLAEDKIEPPGVNDGDFTLTDLGQLRTIYQEANRRDFILGDERDLENIDQDHAFMALWAGNVGLVVGAKSLEVLSIKGLLKATKSMPRVPRGGSIGGSIGTGSTAKARCPRTRSARSRYRQAIEEQSLQPSWKSCRTFRGSENYSTY